MNNFALNLPINSVSFGQTSTMLLRELFNRKYEGCIFPIGNVDLGTQTDIPQPFAQWLQNNVNSSIKKHKRSTKIFKLWHLMNSLESFSDDQTLFSFYECDNPTSEELNIIKNNRKVIFSNQYTVDIFKDYGCNNVVKIPLAFDKYNFKKLDKQYFTDGRISFLLPGKLELTRKRTGKVIQAWVKKFGNNPKYFLNCATHNPFIPQDQLNNLYGQILNGVRYSNIQFFGFLQNNALYNDLLNGNEIIIGMGTEGFNLPLLTGLGLGKMGVALNVAGHKEFCRPDNCVLVNPSGKIPIYDNMFFHQGNVINQGNCFDFDENEFIAGCEEAIKRVESNKVNENGLKLQEEFSIEKMTDRILKEINEDI